MNAQAMRIALLLLVGGVVLPAAARAQVWVGANTPRRGSVEIGGAAVWSGGQEIPSESAVLTRNPGTGSGPLELFSSDGALDPAFGGQGTVAFYVTPALAVEAGARISRPGVSVTLRNDFEGAPNVTASTTMTQYLFTGSLVYHFNARARTTPFIAAGAGHLRDVHAGNELVETGTEFHGKAGVKLWFGRRRSLAFRAEAGVSSISGGFSVDNEERRTMPSAAAGLSYVF